VAAPRRARRAATIATLGAEPRVRRRDEKKLTGLISERKKCQQGLRGKQRTNRGMTLAGSCGAGESSWANPIGGREEKQRLPPKPHGMRPAQGAGQTIEPEQGGQGIHTRLAIRKTSASGGRSAAPSKRCVGVISKEQSFGNRLIRAKMLVHGAGRPPYRDRRIEPAGCYAQRVLIQQGRCAKEWQWQIATGRGAVGHPRRSDLAGPGARQCCLTIKHVHPHVRGE
jgi:hypothetical protein